MKAGPISSAFAVWNGPLAHPYLPHMLARGCLFTPLPGSTCVLVLGPRQVLAEYRSVIGGPELTIGDVMRIREPTPEEMASDKVVDLREPL